MSKNITIKQFNNNTFEELYPKTISSQISGLGNTIFSIIGSQGFSKIETGSYVGTGSYGSSNPNSLTFGFAPKFAVLYIYGNNGFLYGFGSTSTYYIYAMFADELSETYKDGYGFSFSAGSSSGLSYGQKSADGKTYRWYGTRDADAQANSAGAVYHYIAIG